MKIMTISRKVEKWEQKTLDLIIFENLFSKIKLKKKKKHWLLRRERIEKDLTIILTRQTISF